MKKKIITLAALWLAIAAVWIGGFAWQAHLLRAGESDPSAEGAAQRAASSADPAEPVIYTVPENETKTDGGGADQSSAAPAAPAASAVPAASAEEVPEGTDGDRPGEAEAGTVYVVNSKTKKIHLPDCSSVKDIKAENRTETSDPDALIAEGYAWCKRCHG